MQISLDKLNRMVYATYCPRTTSIMSAWCRHPRQQGSFSPNMHAYLYTWDMHADPPMGHVWLTAASSAHFIPVLQAQSVIQKGLASGHSRRRTFSGCRRGPYFMDWPASGDGKNPPTSGHGVQGTNTQTYICIESGIRLQTKPCHYVPALTCSPW